MKKYIDFLDKHKYKVLIFITLLVALLSISLKELAYEGNYRIWFDKESKVIKDYDNFRATFSGDDVFVISFKDENGIFNPKTVEMIRALTKDLRVLEGVERIDSLTNYQYISNKDDEFIVEDFIKDNKDLAHKKTLALKDKLILNQLISKDAKTTMLAVKLDSFVGSDEALNISLMQSIETLLEGYEKKYGYHFFISGTPAITASLVTISQGDAMILMPLAVVVVVVLLFLLFRDYMGVIVPSIVIVFTFLLVLSMQMLMGYKLNNFTVNIPSFISAIAIADSMHLYLAWLYFRIEGLANKEAVYQALKTNTLPIMMTSFTTAVGFATLGISEIEPISTLGIAITSGAIIAFVLSMSVAPAILLMSREGYVPKRVKFLSWLPTKGYGAFITRHDKTVVGAFIMIMLFIGYGLKDVVVDSNSIKYFDEETVVRSGSEFIEKEITGPLVYEVVVDSNVLGGAKEPQFLEKMVTFEEAFRVAYPHIRFITSLKDIMIRMQEVLNPDANTSLPQTKELVAQYLLLYAMNLSPDNEINDKIDTDEQRLRITCNCNITDSSKDLEMMAWVEKWWADNSKYSASVQGQTVIFSSMQSGITDTLIVSISLTLLIVMIAMFLIYKNIKLLWLFMLPNLAPIVLVAGVMGYLGIRIDVGVAISAAVILGIAVDDTIHFFSKYFYARKTESFEDAIDYVLKHSGNAMILTTFILSFTFGIFAVSSFVPNVNFAIVTVCALNIALVLDLLLLPALLSLFDRREDGMTRAVKC